MAKKNALDKILDLDALSKTIKRLRSKKKTVVLCHGVFDLLHPGHIRHFELAKRMGDVLVVTLTQDEYVNKGPGRPVFNQRLRAESVAALECVDYVAVNNWPTAVETIKYLKPCVYVKGSDYKRKEDDITGKIVEEEEAIKSVKGRLAFTDDITFSSSEILNQHFNVYSKEADTFLRQFKTKYSSEKVLGLINDIKDLKVLVVGDVIVDEYVYCAGMGKPAKADIIAAKYLREEKFTGGSLAVAKHIANFCKKVHIVSALGPQKEYLDFINNNLMDNITAKFFFREDMPTVVKRRYLNPSFLTKTFEINFLDDRPMPKKDTAQVVAYLGKILKEYDLVIAADFGHGFMNGDVVDCLSKKAKFLCVNTQANSANMGYNLITKYKKADYICIDEPEVRLAMHDKFGKVEDLILKLSRALKCGRIIITRGHLGATVFEKGKGFTNIPVFSKEIVDRLGAGDAFLSVTSPLVFKGNPMEVVGVIGNAVGALAVLIVGNKTPVESVQLSKFIKSLLK